MKKIHVVAVALLLGLAAVFGLVAATRTAGVASAGRTHVSDAVIAARSRKLTQAEKQLRRALRDRPPALPAVPAGSKTGSAPAQVVYRRPAPLIVVRHSAAHGDDGREHEHGSEGEDD